jgi:hypothetical protein
MELDMHHCNRKPGDDRPENILLLCTPCHSLEHRDECPICGQMVGSSAWQHDAACRRRNLARRHCEGLE